MQLNRFDLNLLIALDALLHERNVTRAAERVFISQPAMSAALQKLREFPQSLRIVDLRPVKWLCAVAKDHPTVGDELTEAQYLALPHVFGWPSGHTLPLEELVRRLLNADLDVRATTQGLLEIPFMLAGTQLVATLPEDLARTLAKLAPVKLLPVPFETPDTREVVMCHKRNEPDPGHAWLRDVVIAAARSP